MIKNYFLELGELFKNIGVFVKETFKTHLPKIWLFMLLQLIFGVFVLYLCDGYSLANMSLGAKINASLMFVIYIVAFFFMFKNIFNLGSKGLEKENISNAKIVKTLLSLGLLNCIPFLVFLLCYILAQIIPNSTQCFKVILYIFTYLFYLSMSLSICSVVKFQDKNLFCAIFESVKIFFKKILLALPIIFILFVIAGLFSFLICTVIYSIGLYFHFLTDGLINSIHTLVNIYSLYVIASLYIGYQVAFLNKYSK